MGPKKQKLTKAEKLALKLQEEEKIKQEEELARRKAEEEKRQRQEEERLLQEQLEKIRLEEAETREKQVSYLLPIFTSFQEKYKQNKVEEWNKFQWNQYVHVWKKLNSLSLPMVNAFLSEWEDDERGDMKEFFHHCHECLQIMQVVESSLLNCPELNSSLESSWKEILVNVKAVLYRKIDLITYLLLRNASESLSPDSYNMEYGVTDLAFEEKLEMNAQPMITLCLWANLVKNLRYKGMHHTELGVNFELPSSLVLESCAVRILYTSFDTLPSSLSDTDAAPSLSLENMMLQEDIPQGELFAFSETKDQFGEYAVAPDDSASYKAGDLAETSGEAASSYIDSSSTENFPHSESSTTMGNRSSTALSSSSTTDVPSSSTELVKKEALTFPPPEETKMKFLSQKEYFAVGGIIHFDLFKVPAQPVEAGSWILIYCENKVPEKIFYKTNITPIRQPPPDMPPVVAAEFSDSEIKRFDQEMTTALTLSLRLPKGVLFLEQPKPAFWLTDKNCFTTSGFFDVHLNDDRMLSFKSSQFGKIVLLQRKYANHPLKSWELMPQKESESVSVILTGIVVAVKIKVDSGGCYIQSINQGKESIFPELYDLCFSPEELLKKLLEVGINLKYHESGSKYIKIPSKVLELERWTSLCMSLLCFSFAFSSSKWNKQLSSDQIVMQSWEVNKNISEENKCLVLINPERAIYLKCSESSTAFSEESIGDQEFSSDLFYLLTKNHSEESIQKIRESNVNVVMNLHILFHLCRIFSCS